MSNSWIEEFDIYVCSDKTVLKKTLETFLAEEDRNLYGLENFVKKVWANNRRQDT